MQIRKTEAPAALKQTIAAELTRVDLALRAVLAAQEATVSLHDDIAALKRNEAERTAQIAALAEAINTLDANVRLIAEAMGGLRTDLAPRTALGRLLQQLLIGGNDDRDRSQ